MWIMFFEKELKRIEVPLIFAKTGSEKICLITKTAKKTAAQITTRTSSPANVKIWFRIGREGATVLKMLLIDLIIEAKSFRAIQIIKKIRTMFIPEKETPFEIVSMYF